MFSCEFFLILRNTVFIEHLGRLLLEYLKYGQVWRYLLNFLSYRDNANVLGLIFIFHYIVRCFWVYFDTFFYQKLISQKYYNQKLDLKRLVILLQTHIFKLPCISVITSSLYIRFLIFASTWNCHLNSSITQKLSKNLFFYGKSKFTFESILIC